MGYPSDRIPPGKGDSIIQFVSENVNQKPELKL